EPNDSCARNARFAGIRVHYINSRLRRIPNYFQLLIQPLGGNRDGRANFLREQGNLELFNHPSKGFDLTQRLGGSRRLGLEFPQYVLIRRELAETILVFRRIQDRPFGANEQPLEIHRQMGQPLASDSLQKTGRDQAGQFLGQWIDGADSGRWSELVQRGEGPGSGGWGSH